MYQVTKGKAIGKTVKLTKTFIENAWILATKNDEFSGKWTSTIHRKLPYPTHVLQTLPPTNPPGVERHRYAIKPSYVHGDT